MSLTDLAPATPDRQPHIPVAPRNAQRFAAFAVDVMLPATLTAVIVVLMVSMPADLGFWQTDRLAVGALGVVLVGSLIVVDVQRRRRGQSLGMAAIGLVDAPGYGVRSVAELRRAKIDVDALLTRPRHPWRTVTAILVLTVVVGLIAVAVGARNVTLPDVAQALFTSPTTYNDMVIRQRAPRALMAAAAGMALGIAGAIIQGQTNNPLADPDLMGVTRGATFAAVLAIWLGGLTTPSGYGWFSLAGALVVVVLVVLLAESTGATLVSLPLIGAAIASVLGGATGIVLLLDQTVQQSFRQWMIGGLSDRPLDTYWMPLAAIGVGLIMAVACASSLNALSLGSDVATSLGSDVRRARILGLLTVGILVGAATAVCGPIAFLGLIAPHTARLLVGNNYRVLLPASALLGAVALMFADVVGRVIARPTEIQAGVVFAMIGAPLFIALARLKSGDR
jgi:iron complex transport system permease protein